MRKGEDEDGGKGDRRESFVSKLSVKAAVSEMDYRVGKKVTLFLNIVLHFLLSYPHKLIIHASSFTLIASS